MAIEDIYNAVLEFDEVRVAELVGAELAAGTPVETVLNDGLVAALDTVGARFSEGTIFVPEMLLAADAMKEGLNLLRPLLAETGSKPVGKVVLGTVKGDLHDIGKNLVGMMLEGAGFKVIDIGIDVAAETFVSSAQENEADIVAMSGLLTTAMAEMEKAVSAVVTANHTRNLNVRIMIGGPPVNQAFADKVGAHGYGVDAPAAVALARELVNH